MLRKGIGLDIGTTQTTICTVDEGILLKEPSVIAVDVDTNEVLEAGNAAFEKQKAAPDHVKLVQFSFDDMVRANGFLTAMLRIFLRRAIGRSALRPRVMVSIPCDLTEAQTNALEDAVLAAGVAHVHLLEAPLCAALGVGLDFSSPVGQMLVHIGASRTEAAMIFIGDMVTHVTVPVGGSAFDSAIMRYLRDRHGLFVGRRTAEQVKIRIGKLIPDKDKKLEVRGRSTADRSPRSITICEPEMLVAMKDPMIEVLDAVMSVIELTGPDLKADIAKNGIVLTGSGVLGGMDQFLADVIGVRAKCASNAATAAAEGAAIALDRLGK